MGRWGQEGRLEELQKLRGKRDLWVLAGQEQLHGRGGNFSWALGAEKNKENQGRKKEFQVGLTGEQNLIGRESAGIFSVAKNRNPLWLAHV